MIEKNTKVMFKAKDKELSINGNDNTIIKLAFIISLTFIVSQLPKIIDSICNLLTNLNI